MWWDGCIQAKGSVRKKRGPSELRCSSARTSLGYDKVFKFLWPCGYTRVADHRQHALLFPHKCPLGWQLAKEGGQWEQAG